MRRARRVRLAVAVLAGLFLLGGVHASVAIASSTDGTIDATNRLAEWLDTSRGFVNFAATNGNVHVTDSGLTGYAWADQFGWINLSPTNGGVHNDGNGTLSGYAWGQATGWINFKPTNGGVTIDTSGNFSGYAWSANFGWLVFNCATNNSCATNNFKVSTDWRPASVRTVAVTPVPAKGGGGFGIGVISPAPAPAPTPTSTPTEQTPPSPPPTQEPSTPPPATNPTTPPPSGAPEVSAPSGALSEIGGGSGSSAGPSSGNPQASGSGSSVPAPAAGGFSDAVAALVQQVTNTVDSAVPQAIPAAAATIEAVRSVVESPQGDATAKIVVTGGAVAGAVGTASALFATPLSFPEIILIPLRLWGLLLAAFGLKRRFPPWGVVYDSVTKQPIDPVRVVARDMMGKVVGEAITDFDGRYGFLLPPGMYVLEASKTNYRFPSEKLRGRTADELYRDIYLGERFEVPLSGPVVQRNIPLDPLGFDWNEFVKNKVGRMAFYSRRNRLMTKLATAIFDCGAVLSLITTALVPSSYNIAILALYVILAAARLFGVRPRSYGTISESRSGEPLSFAAVRIFLSPGETFIAQKVADKFGRYFCLVPKGEYVVAVDKKNIDESYAPVLRGAPVHAKEGIIRQDFEV